MRVMFVCPVGLAVAFPTSVGATEDILDDGNVALPPGAMVMVAFGELVSFIPGAIVAFSPMAGGWLVVFDGNMVVALPGERVTLGATEDILKEGNVSLPPGAVVRVPFGAVVV